MITLPPFLKPGDTIGICCPSGYLPIEKAEQAKFFLNQWGYEILIGKTVGNGENYFSGTDEERKNDLQYFLDRADIKAIIMGRGGYGMSRIIDDLNFEKFTKNPKWLCGFSDITVLHSHINKNYNTATLHTVMCGAFTPETEYSAQIQSFKQTILGELITYNWSYNTYNILGNIEGELVGGNLAMLAHLTGSKSQLETKDKILFIEDIGEHLYNIDRMLMNLKRSGQLSQIKALLVGSFTDTQDTTRPFGQELHEIILDKVSEYKIPVAFDFDCGHQDKNLTIILGAQYQLNVTPDCTTLTPLTSKHTHVI
jgi:muramoyltetrapeptide carboxypeptidase